MKKIFVLIIMILFMSVNAIAAEQRRITSVISATNDSVFSVPTTTTVYTKAFWLKSAQNDEDVGVMYKATSGGSVDLNIDLEQSYAFPGTEGADDSTFLLTHNVDTELTDENWHLATIDSVVMPVGRFVVTGEGSNAASTLITIKVGKH